jgi:hypothetical protein
MIQTKRELVADYRKGILRDSAYYNPSAFDVVMIIELTDEMVFGYYQYQTDKQEFFKLKLNALIDDYSFRLSGKMYRLSDFLRL